MSTPNIFRFPVRSADIWGLMDEEKRTDEDIAADLDYQDNSVEQFLSNTAPAAMAATFGRSLGRGREAGTFDGTGVLTGDASYGFRFKDPPRIMLTVESETGEDIRPILISVSTTGFTYRLRNADEESVSPVFIHWVAVGP
jgi:hypothetical protein